MKHLVLGTAGHVDHGKTALVKALTGVDTDRLEEEKMRGITIVLGFAELTLPGGTRAGIVDVPGHERFISNMLAGIGGIDLVMLVVAADEGIMPQTREHFDICRLLNIQRGLTVITKVDLVDQEWLELVTQEVEELVGDTFLQNGDIFPVSAKTGQGIPELLAGLEGLCQGVTERESGGIFRLPVDRVFTMKGFGTVVTGTLISGKVSNGDTIEVLPAGLQAKVRGVQVHSQSVDYALAGQRTALNLQGVDKELIQRGNTVTIPERLTTTYMIDAVVTLLSDAEKPLKNRRMVRFYTGSSRGIANVVLLDREELRPGEVCYAQLRLREMVVTMGGDRCILRSMSENRTIGGGLILDPLPIKHKSSEKNLIPALQVLEKGKAEEKAEVFLYHSGFRGMDLAAFRCRLPLAEGTSRKVLQKLREKGKAFTIEPESLLLLHQDYYEVLKKKVLAVLTEFHDKKPLEPGIAKAELFSRLSIMIQEKMIQAILDRMKREETIAVEGKLVRLTKHKVRLNTEEEEAVAKIEATYRQAGLKPPSSKSLAQDLDLDTKVVPDLLRHLTETKRLVHIQGDLFMNPETLHNAKQNIRSFIEKNKEISVAELRELLQSTRKYMIPLLEYLDAIKFTARKGDKRILR